MKELIGKFHNYNVYIVKGSEVRKHDGMGDFFDCDVHGSENYGLELIGVPSNEIWVSSEIDDEEKRAVLASAFRYLILLSKGVSKDKAYEDSRETERGVRKKYNTLTQKDIPIKKLGEISNITVLLVNGKAIRNLLDDDFVEGGHDLVYQYIPLNNIWIDNSVDKSEYRSILVHEYVERFLMKTLKLKYDDAHKIASDAEYKYREKQMIKLKNLFEDSDWTKKILSKFFKNGVFDSRIRKKLLEIALNFYKELDVNFKLKDVWLTGSNVSYNYTKYSDLDVHLMADFDSISINNEILKQLFTAKKSLWNDAHDITIKGHEVELYIQDIKEPHIANGIYSLVKGDWVEKPTYVEPQTSKELVKEKADKIMAKINRLERSFHLSMNKDGTAIYQDAKRLKDFIVSMRKEGLKTPDGMFSLENLIFKELRNNGYMEKLIDLINISYDTIYTENKK